MYDLGPADCHASGSVRAVIALELDALEIRLCNHCADKHGKAMTSAGWVRTAQPSKVNMVGASL